MSRWSRARLGFGVALACLAAPTAAFAVHPYVFMYSQDRTSSETSFSVATTSTYSLFRGLVPHSVEESRSLVCPYNSIALDSWSYTFADTPSRVATLAVLAMGWDVIYAERWVGIGGVTSSSYYMDGWGSAAAHLEGSAHIGAYTVEDRFDPYDGTPSGWVKTTEQLKGGFHTPTHMFEYMWNLVGYQQGTPGALTWRVGYTVTMMGQYGWSRTYSASQSTPGSATIPAVNTVAQAVWYIGPTFGPPGANQYDLKYPEPAFDFWHQRVSGFGWDYRDSRMAFLRDNFDDIEYKALVDASAGSENFALPETASVEPTLPPPGVPGDMGPIYDYFKAAIAGLGGLLWPFTSIGGLH